MLKFKKILLLSAALIAFGSLIGCNNQKEETVKSENSKIEITVAEETNATELATKDVAENNTKIIAANGNVDFYKQRLDEFNSKYDTKYVLPASDEEAMEWITSLSPKAFDDFLMALYDGSAYDIEQPRVRNNDIPMGGMYGEIDNTESYEETDKVKEV